MHKSIARKAAFAAITLLILGVGVPARASVSTPPVGADGAVYTNMSWEAGTSPYWYVELQRYGADYVAEGIRLENDSEIQYGLSIFNWAWAHQNADGSFSCSDQFHSTSFFLEAAARTVLMLKAYHPVSYTDHYSTTISSYTAHIQAAAYWMLQAANNGFGQAEEVPYGHRYWMDAACFAESAVVCHNDANLLAKGAQYADSGLAWQLGTGWQAAIIRNADGSYPPAVLIPTGSIPPAGTVQVISAAGVNPEAGGYDVSYQGIGLLMADRYRQYCSTAAMRSSVGAMITSGLRWQTQWVALNGTVSWYGSSRVGIETDRSGVIKGVDYGSTGNAFGLAGQLLHVAKYTVISTRIADWQQTPSPYIPTSTGAISTNANYDAGTSTTYDISLQTAGLQYVQSGIALENDGMIRTGIGIYQWGFAHEASDGTFPNASGSYWQPVLFAESAAHAALLLQSYSPSTYTKNTAYYDGVETQFAAATDATAQWMLGANESRIQAQFAPYASHLYGYAIALAEARHLNSGLNSVAVETSSIQSALALQMESGASLEKGLTDPNAQAFGIDFGGRYTTLTIDTTLAEQLNTMVFNGLAWESQFVDSHGNVINVTDPATMHISGAFLVGYDVTASPLYLLINNRMMDPAS